MSISRTNHTHDDWFQKQVRHRANEALNRLNAAFAEEHKFDTDEHLISYVCSFAKTIGRTPNAEEVIGGLYIASRFNGWENLVNKAGLPKPSVILSKEKQLIFRQELKHQENLLRQERQAKKGSVREARAQKQEQHRKDVWEKARRDEKWGLRHGTDTEEQLLEYVRQCAAVIGHTPVSREVEGATWIAHKIGSWPLVLTLAGLPLPKGMMPPNSRSLKIYRERKQAEKQDSYTTTEKI